MDDIHHVEEKVKVMPVNNIGVITSTCKGVAEEGVDILKHEGIEVGDLGQARIITVVRAQPPPTILLILSSYLGNQ